ncbi:MAG: polysaccharide pyruvyl transferase family protein [Candidatus Competibacter sp.]|nr:polysaccharide pyruvyl transferase family protein [Candidatus Competibacteraceae bacterium]MBL8254868.1 polysaccharide pyruvyl transferase family protein [Candidatus Competibacter sp.]
MALIYHLRPATPNIGNRLIIMATHALLEEEADGPLDLINMPAKGIDAVLKRGGLIRETIYDINHMGAGVLVGPGNLFENNGLEIDPVALGALEVPLLLFSVATGRIYDNKGALRSRTDAMPESVVKALCDKAAGILVRDTHTRDYLAAFGFPHARVIGCPVLSLRPDRLNLPKPDRRAADAVLISLRNPLLMNVSPRLQLQVHVDLRRLIDGLRAQGQTKIALLCHDPRDLRFAAGHTDVPLLYTENPLRYLGWLRDSQLNISYRVHSLLPCATLGTPCVHFTYDERALGLIDTAALHACSVDYVHDPDPVGRALAACAEPDALRKAQKIARSGWTPLQEMARSELKRWLNRIEQT